MNSFIEVTMTQSAQRPVERSLSLGVYLFVGALGFLAVGSFIILFIPSRPPSTARDNTGNEGGEIKQE
jgi:hypothetical protein